MPSRPVGYVPQPAIGLIYQMPFGDRYKVVTLTRDAIGSVPVDVKSSSTWWLSRFDWDKAFRDEGWLTV